MADYGKIEGSVELGYKLLSIDEAPEDLLEAGAGDMMPLPTAGPLSFHDDETRSLAKSLERALSFPDSG